MHLSLQGARRSQELSLPQRKWHVFVLITVLVGGLTQSLDRLGKGCGFVVNFIFSGNHLA